MAKKKSKPNTIDIPSIKVDSFTNEEDNIELTSINNPYSISMYLQSNTDPKYFSKFIKRVERVIRTNKDYEEYLTYLRDDKNLNYCSIFHNISDVEAKDMARDIAKKIESELKYPGEIKVTLIRENRIIEYAR
jgi:hypothetical protein